MFPPETSAHLIISNFFVGMFTLLPGSQASEGRGAVAWGRLPRQEEPFTQTSHNHHGRPFLPLLVAGSPSMWILFQSRPTAAEVDANGYRKSLLA
jgi:hypothetical protein